ncbi:thioredoxin family protein [Legionella sp.]|uniref:thioredoxin family protein n=1 Tax=Legionella sp. TaxID=459 RepID=UPI003CC040A6
MPSQNVTSTEFESLINENQIVFIDFWADWCAPCKQFTTIYEQVSVQFPNIKFAKVNIEAEQELANFFEIRSIPHLMVFKDAIVVYSNAGNMPASALNELVRQVLATDISAIKALFEQGDQQK